MGAVSKNHRDTQEYVLTDIEGGEGGDDSGSMQVGVWLARMCAVVPSVRGVYTI